jgi:hypothetical protein
MLFLAALCTTCTPPLFDFTLSQSVAVVKNMTRDNPSLITVDGNSDQNADGFVLYPRIALAQNGVDFTFDYANGFAVFSTGFSVNVRGLGGGEQSQPLSPDSHMPAYAAWPVKSSDPSLAFLLGLGFNASNPQQNGYAFFQSATTGTSVLSSASLSSTTLVAGDTVIGASFAAQPTMDDVASWLVFNPATASYHEMQLPLMSGTPPTLGTAVEIRSPSPYALDFIPAGTTHLRYFYDADPSRTPNRSFASWFDSTRGGWKCATWWGTTGTGDWEMLPIDHRVDALLSTGELLSTEGGAARIYSRDGFLLAAFPLADLAFIGEEYIGGVFRTYFSQCLRYDNRLHFNVYWVQTDKLKETIGG